MKNSFYQIFMASIAIIAIGCTSMTTKQEQIDNTIKIQADVLRNLVQLRGQEPLKSKINSDPVLMEEESVLISGISSVIKSQEIYLSTKNKPEMKRVENER